MKNLIRFILEVIKSIFNRVEVSKCNLNSFKIVDTQEKTTLNRKIWFYWAQGIEDAPEIVKESLKSWQIMNPEYDVVVLNKDNIVDYVGCDPNKELANASVKLGEAGKSDFIRLLLLYYNGGIWVDATSFCLKPLRIWLDSQHEKNSFINFKQKPGNAYDRVFVSWFLSSNQGSKELRKLLDLTVEYIFRDRKFEIKTCKYEFRRLCVIWGPDKTGFGYLKFMESLGFVPYFWLFYLYNESNIRSVDFEFEFNYCLMKELIKDGDLVSKQTYKGDYQGSVYYKDRCDYFETLGVDIRSRKDG